MKKIITLTLIALSFNSFSQVVVKPKEYTVKADIQTWQAIIQLMNMSSGPHTSVEQAKAFIVMQIDEQAKHEDSLAKISAAIDSAKGKFVPVKNPKKKK